MQEGDSLKGFVLALAAYLLWSALPLYLKLLQSVPVAQVLAHRIVWSVPVALLILVALGRTGDLRRAIVSPRLLAMAGLTAALITVNWATYLYAVQTDRVLDAALGYYINPLFSIFLGGVVLGERLRGAQWVAVGLALSAVVVLTVEAGSLPVIAVILTLSWGLYALFKRSLPIGPNQGFTLEVLILAPVAAGYLAWVWGQGGLVLGDVSTGLLLLGCGVVTAVPLMLYANGAKMLTLTTIALMQYITPSFLFVLAVFVFDEPLGLGKALAFPLIWAALIVYSVDLLRRHRQSAGAAR